MDNLINNFSIDALQSFFYNKISSFKPIKENLSDILLKNNFNQFTDLLKIGETTFNGSEDLLVFTCKAKTILSERSSKKQQFEIAKKVLKEDFKDGAIFVFYDDAGSFRFSFLRKNYGNKEQKFTTWKRYTYYIEKDKTNKTFKNRIGNADFSSLDAIQKAFSVEKLTEDFYKELFAWYQWTLSEEIGVTFPNNTETHEDDRVKLEEQIIRLITRLLFVWFIKQKKLVPAHLFDTENLKNYLKDFNPNSKEDGNYYNAILQNLFFATLNKEISERAFSKLVKERDIKTLYRYAEMFSISETEVLALFNQVPFLNGGLFECLDKTEKMNGTNQVLDGFSKNPTKSANGNFKHRAFIPNCIFFDDKKGIIPLLERYNFTVEENAPNEIQVALDPELLGNVFENLLGAFNPETKETARKQSGSFYTPKEIVSYMVDESLIFYLHNSFPNLKEESIRELFTAEELPLDFANNQALCEEVSLKLKEIKILDPACGSGAFPMGILNRMVEVLEKLACHKEKSIYDLKLHLIEECIYGVDIQTIAVQISKLRFFISLIVEEHDIDFTNHQNNYGILTLPNLETKFVAANTLIGIKRKPAQHNLFENPQIDQTKEDLLEIRKEHFYAKTANRKKTLREKDAELREKLSLLLQNNNDYTAEDAIQFSKWNPYDQNASSPFFDVEWMFGLKSVSANEGCFDVVIGNPPYVQLQKDGGRLAKMYDKLGYKTFERMGDIYSLFYEKGNQILKNGGCLTYITSNKWMRAGYGESTRRYFAEKTNPILLIDFAGHKIFDNATVDTNILMFQNAKNEGETKSCIVKKKWDDSLHNYVNDNQTINSFTSSNSWIVLSPIELGIKEKIEKIGTPLKDWDVNIYRGILTGYNEAFIIDGKKKDELIAEDPKSAEIIRPILRGRDIKRYSYEFAELYIIAMFPSKKYDIENYPAVKQHLLSFGYDRLKQTGDKGARKKTTNKWYETQDSIGYWEDFYKQKIIYPNMTKYLPFVFDDKGYLTNQKCFIITGENIAFLTAFLNSSLFKYCFKDNFPELLGGTRELSKIFFEKIPVLQVSEDINTEFERLINQLQDSINNSQVTQLLEIQIDNKIFDLYCLNNEEREIIGFIEIE
ncbi:Eco57I restriction-modification methylase domain-containing protein [Pedobacter puniceum]|uniref:site-specific DNA-methyltransferase (adenine-specific) n=1 Tax=Pedobacter puniceum TaxID=2666136 RepID=A0A7K0FKA5_9SPHI|nr:TaqI-like C-terminal specificity domain-containing protein [Pedobacter puniceum]MRX46404.1 N-6 DNA methylase [Pedobacter puniceum]